MRPDDRTDAALAVRVGDHTSHFPTDYSGAQVDSNQFSTEQGTTVGVEAGRILSGRAALRLSASLARTRTGYDDGADSAADTLGYGFASVRSSRIGRRVLDGRVVVNAADWLTVTGGVELSGESERQTGTTSSNFGAGVFDEEAGYDHSRTNRALYGHAGASLATGLDLDAGLRLEDNEVFGGFTTWRAGLVWLPGAEWRAHFSAGTAFRQPTFAEQFAATPFEVGDPSLAPERAMSWEAGVELSPTSGVRLSATWFDQRFDDLIQYQAGAPGAPTYANVARALARGLEVGAGWTPATGLGATAQWTWVNTEVLESGSPGPGFAPGGRLLRRPSHSASGRAWWRGRSGLRLDGDLQWTGSRDDMDYREFPAARVEMTPYTLVNFSAELPIRLATAGDQPLAAMVRIENLFGTSYQTVVGFPGRGRTLLAGIRLGH